MEKSTFIQLPKDSYFHNNEGDEWQVIGARVDELFCRCTKSEGKCFEVGVELFLSSGIAPYHQVGRLPINYQIASGNVETLSINDALKCGLQKGDKVSIELTYDFGDGAVSRFSLEDGSFLTMSNLSSKVTFVPKEYSPIHDEICDVQTTYCAICKCRVIVSNGKIYAAVILDENGVESGTLFPKEIKKFIKI